MNYRFARVDQLDEPLIDWDSRPSGDHYILKYTKVPTITKPPTLIHVGRTRTKIIYAPPLNWVDWRAKYPTMPIDVFNENYLPVPSARMLYGFCMDCGHNTLFKSVCLRCMRMMEIEIEDKQEIRDKLRKMLGSYYGILIRGQ